MIRMLLLAALVIGVGMIRADDDKAKPKADAKPAAKPVVEGPPEFDVQFWDGSNVVVGVAAKSLTATSKYGTTSLPWVDVKRIDFSGKRGEKMKPTIAIETSELTLKGAIDFADITVKTKQFGETSLKFEMVKSMRRVAVPGSGNEFAIKADKHAKQNWSEWYDTGITVGEDDAIEIVASGEIDQWSQTPGQYKSTPKGNGSMVGPPPGGTELMRPDMSGPPGSFGMRPRLTSGMLVGRIGETGKLFLVGDKYTTKRAGAKGKLYLIIAPSNWGNDSTGEYKVTVKVGE